jgi:hypothetical protein
MLDLNEETKLLMQRYFSNLSERDRRLYAGYESSRLGWGGINFVHSVLGIHRSSIRKGQKELLDIEVFAEIELGKQRRKGGGRKKKPIPNPKSGDS